MASKRPSSEKKASKQKQVYGEIEAEQDLFSKTKRHFYRKTQTELVIGYVVHVVLLGFYVFARVYEATVIKRMSEKSRQAAFPASNLYGGRWRFLTYIDMWLQTIYFFLAFFVDVMPQSSVKVSLSKMVDFLFTSIVFPMAMFVLLTFWGIFAIDRELVYPSALDEHIPALLNHFWHTTVAVCVVIELLLVYHKYPRTTHAALMAFAFTSTYVVWTIYLFMETKVWPYKFMYLMPPPVMGLFFAASFIFNLLLYLLGKTLSRLRFGDLEPVEKED